MSSNFLGCSPNPLTAHRLRQDNVLTISRLSFATEANLRPQEFADELKQYLNDLAEIATAEFQVTQISVGTGEELKTRLRYELVGTGIGFHREGRVGGLQLSWRKGSSGEYKVQSWSQQTETRSRTMAPVYEGLTAHAFSSNHSYSAQLLHGVDYWRTVLDGACGIDIYGHNGVSVGDVHGNGRNDLYVCQPAGLPNRLYRNRGDGTFEDITEASGVGVLDNTACALFADVDNNGRQDLIVVRANGPLLFLNEGNGKFRQKPDAFQFANQPQGTFTGAAMADYDRDGWLDVYFCLYVYYQGAGQYKYPTPYYDANNGPPNFLLRNNRDGTFKDVTAQAGLNQNNTRYSFCCGWMDGDQNGWPDLYVVNDFGRKNLYRNRGDGTFTDIAEAAGVADVGAGMSVATFDYDNDGAEDLYVANMWTAAGERIAREEKFKPSSSSRVRALYHKHAMGNSLFQNKGRHVFEDKSAVAGIGIGRWAWSSDAWDFDHDGLPDVYVANGMISGPIREDLNGFFWREVVANSPDDPKSSHEYEQGWTAVNELIREDYSWSGFERNIFYSNNGDGTFTDVSGALGLDFVEDGRAFALADFDGDGRLEVLLKNRNAPQIRLLKNVVEKLNPSICFSLRGTNSNRDAIGAVVTVEIGRGRQTRTLQAGSGFLSQHSKQLFFGLGQAQGPIRASIRWPSGLVQSLSGLVANQRVFVDEGHASIRTEPFVPQIRQAAESTRQSGDLLPDVSATWLLAPVRAPEFTLPAVNGGNRTLSEWRGKSLLLHLWTSECPNCGGTLAALQRSYAGWTVQGLNLLTVNFEGRKASESRYSFPVLRASEDMVAIYNLLYRWLFDRHRDLSLPTSLLIDEEGAVVRIYQGAINPDDVLADFCARPRSVNERLARALPFGAGDGTIAFGRNYLSLGSVYFQRGYFEQAEHSFQQAVRDDPSSAEAHYGLGSVYLKQSKTAEAQASFEQAVKQKESYPDTKPNSWNNLGLIAAQQKRTDDAIGFFKEALQLNPDHIISLENLGNAYRQQKRWDEAERTLARAVSIAPSDPEANYSLGMVFAQLDDSSRAYEYLLKAVQLRPDFPEAINNLGVLYLRTRRRDDAVAAFEQCIRIAPGFDQSYLNLARVYAIEGDKTKARELLLALLKQHPDQAQAQKALAEIN